MRAAEPGPFAEADDLVRSATGLAFPGAVLSVGAGGRPVHRRAFGRLSYEAGGAEARPDSLYDLASLTKVVVTATLAMILVDEGRLDLDAPVSALFPSFTGRGRDAATIRHLLSHTSGLPRWAPLYREACGREAFLERILALELEYEPGAKACYSDLGFILLADVLERVAGAPLERLARERVLDPLGMQDTLFRPPAALLPRIAATENDPWRGRVLRGEVHDENAFALGGVAGHAGLFGSAPDLDRLAQALLGEAGGDGRRIASPAVVSEFTRRVPLPGITRALGWDTAADGTGRRSSVPGSPGYSSAGSLLSDRSFGHTGFTGTSVWIDPERAAWVVLLTNRVHPTRDNDGIRGVRARVADAVAEACARA